MGNHRADRRGRAAAATRQSASSATRHQGRRHASTAAPVAPAPAGGRRKSTRRERPNPFSKLPTIPTLIGVAALATAAVGAVGLGQGLPGGNISLSAGHDNYSGTDAGLILASRDPRSQAISRDYQRQAADDAQQADLQLAVEQQSQARTAAMASLAKDAERRANEIAQNLWVAPTENYHLTARFGQVSGLWSHFHTGLDFAAPYGTPIFAIADGVITETGYDGAYGNKTVETLADGTEIWYAHQSAIDVTVGERVIQGHQIGAIGATGNVTGPHVHIEVRPGGGDPVDPYPEFVAHGFTP